MEDEVWYESNVVLPTNLRDYSPIGADLEIRFSDLRGSCTTLEDLSHLTTSLFQGITKEHAWKIKKRCYPTSLVRLFSDKPNPITLNREAGDAYFVCLLRK